jgi:hypothetical protein
LLLVFSVRPQRDCGGQILRLDLAALFAPEPDQRLLILAHDDAGVRAADEGAASVYDGGF